MVFIESHLRKRYQLIKYYLMILAVTFFVSESIHLLSMVPSVRLVAEEEPASQEGSHDSTGDQSNGRSRLARRSGLRFTFLKDFPSYQSELGTRYRILTVWLFVRYQEIFRFLTFRDLNRVNGIGCPLLN